MGVQNRQRRAAKQKRRERAARQPRGEQYRISYEELVWATADLLRDATAEEAADVYEALGEQPAGFAAAVELAVVQAEVTVGRSGWSGDDLRELRARRLKVPAGAPAAEAAMRWLVLLLSMPPLPTTAPRRAAPSGDDAVLAKIRALLAKAESTTFPEEAEALSAKAQELMARHRIDHVLLSGDDAGDGPVGRRIWLDDPYADAKAQLLAQVAAANSCRSVVLGGLGCAHVVGFATDLDVVELLHTSLLVQATSAMAAAGPQRDQRGRSRTRSFRQSFLVAYAWRIGQRLRQATDAVTSEASTTSASLLPALVKRERLVEDELTRAFPRTERMRVSTTNAAGYAAGTIAADRADLAVGDRLEP